jgi:RimJ/RimL family protein N-acetyltransferase
MFSNKPILRDFPESFESQRLIIRAPKAGDGTTVNEAVIESFSELNPWMPWAKTEPSVEETEFFCRTAATNYLSREDLQLHLFSKETNEFVGSSGLHRIDWTVPKFEIGYWCRTKFAGQGYIKEAVHRITTFAFEILGANRLEIKADDNNVRSWSIPEKLGFLHEATLRHDALDMQGNLRNTRVYSMVSINELKGL